MTGRHLDLSSPDSSPAQAPDKHVDTARFLGVHFACCEVYSRVYVNDAKTCYVGHCPRCARRVQFRIGEGGTDARFFVAG